MSLLYGKYMNATPGKKESWADMIERIEPGFFDPKPRNVEIAKEITEMMEEVEERKRKLEQEYEENFNRIKSKVGFDLSLTVKLLDNLMKNKAAFSEDEIYAMAEKKEELQTAYADFLENVEGKTHVESLEIIENMYKHIDSAKKMVKKMGGKTDASKTGVSRKGNKSKPNVFSKLRATFKAATANKGKLQTIMKSVAAKRAEQLEAGKKVDFIKEGYTMFDNEFGGKDGYAEFIGTRDYTQAESSVKIPLEKTIKDREIKPEDVKNYLAKKFAGFYEKVYMKKKATAAASASASKPKKGGARKTKKARKTSRKTKKGRKTGRKTQRKH